MLKEKILESSLGYTLWSAPVNRPKVDAIKRMLLKCGNGRVLDVGCGPGTNAEIFVDWEYVGVDLNAQYIIDAQKKYPEKRFVNGDATALGLDGERFPVILINSLMHHLNDAECSQLLNGIKPLLAENGSVIVQEPLTPAQDQKLMRFLMNQDRGDYFRPLPEWKAIFESSGFAVASEEFYKMKLAYLVTGWQMYSALLKPGA